MNIEGHGYEPAANVQVFDRYGHEVYLRKGYDAAWNGDVNDKRLPTGAYYYIVNAKNGSLQFGGEVTSIY